MNKRTLVVLLAFLVLAGCAGADPAFVAAERATHDAVAPDYSNYFHADATLAPDEVRRKQRLLDLWERDLAQQESEVKGKVAGG